MTPKEIVEYLDRYVVGQGNAKRTIAIALRNRWRRMQLDEEMQREVTPKNILMIGNTGVGKTEIARRLSRMMRLPFIKVEASKFTEVGFVGRDVESIIRDLAISALSLVKEEENEKNREKIEAYIENKIIEKLLPPLPESASEQKKREYERAFAKTQSRFERGELDHLRIEVNVPPPKIDVSSYGSINPEMANVHESIIKVIGGLNKKGRTKEVTVKEARKILAEEASEELIDPEKLNDLALDKVQSGGVVFIDEIDKIAVPSNSASRQDPSKEGVQRDLLPIVEGSTVSTKIGTVSSEHILFIAAGAFHISKPSDLIPELQGRFPLRVELDSLDEEALYRILTEPANSLTKQYQALMAVEGVELNFSDDALRAVSKYSAVANERTEDIGARRLHTIMERILEELSFDADSLSGQRIDIDVDMVESKLDNEIRCLFHNCFSVSSDSKPSLHKLLFKRFHL
jgi:ATP-dependent HslUV protease ATP-binding subunit HslU